MFAFQLARKINKNNNNNDMNEEENFTIENFLRSRNTREKKLKNEERKLTSLISRHTKHKERRNKEKLFKNDV